MRRRLESLLATHGFDEFMVVIADMADAEVALEEAARVVGAP
ncbi:MAG: hypothetical protein ACE5GB_04295 [Acidimicrobiales bacterium]